MEDEVGEGHSSSSEWELLVHTPAVFARVASKGLTGYGTRKSVGKMGDREERWENRECPGPPVFL